MQIYPNANNVVLHKIFFLIVCKTASISRCRHDVNALHLTREYIPSEFQMLIRSRFISSLLLWVDSFLGLVEVDAGQQQAQAQYDVHG